MPTVLVTGANRGLGYEHVKQYAQKGRYLGILSTFKKLVRNDSFLTIHFSNSGICR